MSQKFCILSFVFAVLCSSKTIEQVRSLEFPLAIPKRVSNEGRIEKTSPLPSSLVSNAPSPIDVTFLLASLNEIKISSKDFQRDEVVRIVDANAIKLQKNGLVSVGGARCPSAGSNFQFSECSSCSSSYLQGLTADSCTTRGFADCKSGTDSIWFCQNQTNCVSGAGRLS
jgi:hypothetical protein